MTLHIEDESGIQTGLATEELARQVIETALDLEGCPYEAEVNLLLTDNETIRKLNLEYRQIDRATDVLSFPMLEYETPSDFSAAENRPLDSFHPDTGELLLGDIIISMEKVIEQAEAFGHSQKREFAFLIAHSMLHLFGYDHMEPEEAGVMEKKQEAVLNTLNITR